MEPSSYSRASEALSLDYQKPAIEKLLAIAKARFSVNWQQLKIRPRAQTLIIGPSGSGKSFISSHIANILEIPILSLSISEWILLGASSRSYSHTWPHLIRFLSKHQRKPGVLIFLDEIDKLGGDSSWDTHLRNEVYRLIDLQVPPGLEDEDDDLSAQQWKEAQHILQHRTLIVAAGAFQHIWDQNDQGKVGFCPDDSSSSETTVAKLIETLPRELVNRFRSELVILPQLQESDYHRLLEEAKSAIPAHLRVTFLRLGYQRLREAVAFRKGCRFIEELLLDAVIAERSMLFSTDPVTSEISEEANTHV